MSGPAGTAEAVREPVLPAFGGSASDILLSVVDFIHQNVVKTVWPIERIRTTMGNRTVPRILADGDAMAFGPCPDRTLVACAILNRHDIWPVVVYHERRVPGFVPSTAHIAMEIRAGGRDYMMDFGTRESRLLEGNYHFNPDIEETMALKRFDLREMGVDLMSVTPHQMFDLAATEHIKMEQKYAYYEQRSEKYSPDVLEDRLALDNRHSVYYGL